MGWGYVLDVQFPPEHIPNQEWGISFLSTPILELQDLVQLRFSLPLRVQIFTIRLDVSTMCRAYETLDAWWSDLRS